MLGINITFLKKQTLSCPEVGSTVAKHSLTRFITNLIYLLGYLQKYDINVIIRSDLESH